MEDWLVLLAKYTTIVIELLAVIVIAFGTLEAFVLALRGVIGPITGHERRREWLRYARWLVAGLTFQLAADIIHTAVAPSWDDIGKLAAVAVIRTFLNYFLEKDIDDVREVEAQSDTVQARPAARPPARAA